MPDAPTAHTPTAATPTGERAAADAGHRPGWAYLATISPIIFGTTYLLTTEFLPPDRPLLAATMRSLPTGLVLIIGATLPPPGWRLRFLLLSVLYCSAFFPLHFVAAYLLPGGVASVINSLIPILVVLLSVPWLGITIKPVQLIAGGLGVVGIALLVLSSSARLDGWGVLAMTACVIMMSVATVLTKRWGFPPGMGASAFTGWTFLIGGLTLLPFALALEGLPASLTGREIGGIAYLVIFSGIVAYGLWFWGLQRLPASSITFLNLLNPVVAAILGWIVLEQRLNAIQISGAVLVLISVILGQDLDLRGRRRGSRNPRLKL